MGSRAEQVMEMAKERVQDMINGALNPMIDGLRQEVRIAEIRPFWLPNGNRFEYFYDLREYALDQDTLEDLEDYQPAVQGERHQHDERLGELRSTLSRAYDAARCDDEVVAAARRVLAGLPSPAEADEAFILARIAEGADEIGTDYSFAPIWNLHAAALRAQFEGRHGAERQAVSAAFKSFRDAAAHALDKLKQIRRELADRHGVRLKPMEPARGW